MKTRLILIGLGAVVIAGLGVLLYGLNAQRPTPNTQRILRLGGLGGSPSIINPLLTKETVSQALRALIFNSLIRINKEGLAEPDLAQFWDISKDGLTYTFHLRQGVRFHDGVELTSEDVKFTYELALDPEVGSGWRDYFGNIKQLEVTDKYILTMYLKEPDSSFKNSLQLEIVPKHLLSAYKGKLLKTAEFNYKPIGTGPFKFVEWTKDNQIILNANPDYYEGRPYLDQVIATGYDTFSKYWLALMHGETDVMFYLPMENYETIKRDADFKTYSFTSPFTYGLEYNPEHPFLKDKRARQAIAQSVNIKSIINKVENANGTQSSGPFVPGPKSLLYSPNVKPLEYNPSLAIQLLNESGWELNKLGVLEKAGQEFRITMLLDSEIRNGAEITRLIYQDLYKIGIRVTIKTFANGLTGNGEYKNLLQDAGCYLTELPAIIDPVNLAGDWYSKSGKRRNKLWTYHNNEVDKLYEESLRETNQASELYKKIHKIIYDDQAVTWLYFYDNFGVVNSRFQNTDNIFSASMPLYTIKDWRMELSRISEEQRIRAR